MNPKYSYHQVVILSDKDLAVFLASHLGNLGFKQRNIHHFMTGVEAEDYLRSFVNHLLFVGPSLTDVDPIEFAEMISEEAKGPVRVVHIYDEVSPFAAEDNPFSIASLKRGDLSQETIMAVLRSFYF